MSTVPTLLVASAHPDDDEEVTTLARSVAISGDQDSPVSRGRPQSSPMRLSLSHTVGQGRWCGDLLIVNRIGTHEADPAPSCLAATRLRSGGFFRRRHLLRAGRCASARSQKRAVTCLSGLVFCLQTETIMPHDRTCIDPSGAPFVGLRPFDTIDAMWFSGRDRETAALTQKIRNSRFTAVVGPSGSGKSSIVRAGVIPLLPGRGLA